MAENGDNKTSMDELRELAEFMKEYGLSEVRIEETANSRLIRLQRGGRTVAAPSVMVETTSPSASPQPAGNAASPSVSDGGGTETINAPMVGTFYRAARPAEPPFIEEGDRVKTGDVLCIIEAMKLMNHIEAEFPAEVVEILVENATPIEFGTPLFRVRRG